MKVLLVSNMWPSKEKAYSGIFVKNQYLELKKYLGNDLDVFYLKRTFTSTFGSILKYLKAFLRFFPVFFKRYDIVHLHFFYPLIYFVWLYKKLHPKTKVVVTFHGSDISEKINEGNREHFSKIAKCVDFTIPVGKQLAEAGESKLGLKVGKVLSAGVDANVFYKDREGMDKLYDYIFVGSFLPVKGIDILLDVIEDLPKDFSFCIVGKGDLYIDRIKKMIDDGIDITLKIDQPQHELRKLYNQSKFLVQPSREEGFGLVVAEGMFCGLPALVSNVGGFKDQVVNGKNGYLFEKEDRSQLYEYMLALKKINEEEYNKLCRKALISSSKLSLQNVCGRLYKIYLNLGESA